jgi:hypothetical protein
MVVSSQTNKSSEMACDSKSLHIDIEPLLSHIGNSSRKFDKGYQYNLKPDIVGLL